MKNQKGKAKRGLDKGKAEVKSKGQVKGKQFIKSKK